MSTNVKFMTVEIWSDFACPWCWIAKHRFEAAFEKFKYKDLTRVHYRAFRLAPGMAASPIKKVLVDKFGSERSANMMMSMVSENARDAGLIYNFETMLFGDTTKAHTLLRHIEDNEVRKNLTERLYKASTTEGRSIYELSSLREIAAEAGVSGALVERAWNDEISARYIAVDEKEARSVANGVPLFMFNGEFHLSGAQTVETFEKALDRMYYSADSEATQQGQMCGLDGCDS